MNQDKINKLLEGLLFTPEQALQALDSVITIKYNELMLEGHRYQGTEFDASDVRYEYLALLKARHLLQGEVLMGEDAHDCRSCNNFDLYANECLLDGSKGYISQVCIHPDCKNYKEGDWKPQ